MDIEILIKLIMGSIVFVGVPHIANKINKPTTAAIIGAVPVPIFLTFFIVYQKSVMNSWGKMQLILPPMGILFGIIFYFSIVKYNYNKNYVAIFIILLWLSIGLISYFI